MISSRAARCALGAAVVVAAGCWADFPDARLHRDLSTSGDGPAIDAPDAGTTGDGAASCTPGEFIRCSGDTLIRCDAQGTGELSIDCTPGSCNAVLGRCDQCDPSTPPSCADGSVASCTADGVQELTPCAGSCVAGRCCTDGDDDGFSDCMGDCNDEDPLVNPGQSAYFDTPSAGSFDYNCRDGVEPEFGEIDCRRRGSSCRGDGWTAGVPDCGAQGSFAPCVRQGTECEPGEVETRTLKCR